MVRTSTRSPTGVAGDALAHVDDVAADVGPLDARERHGHAGPRGVPGVGAGRTQVAPPSAVCAVTDFEYHPIRVFTSVLLTPAAATWTSTRPVPAAPTSVAVLEPLQPAVAAEEDRGHRRRHQGRHPPPVSHRATLSKYETMVGCGRGGAQPPGRPARRTRADRTRRGPGRRRIMVLVSGDAQRLSLPCARRSHDARWADPVGPPRDLDPPGARVLAVPPSVTEIAQSSAY